MCCQQRGKRDGSMNSFWEILGGEYTYLKPRVLLNLLPYMTKNIPSPLAQATGKLRKKIEEKAFFPSISSENESSWLIPFFQSHICQTFHIMMLWDTVKPYHKVYFRLISVWIIRLINCSNSSPSPWTELSSSWQRWPLAWTEDPWECNVDITVEFIRSSRWRKSANPF